MRRLLIDADIIAYMSSAANQQTWDWGDTGGVSTAADFGAAKRAARDAIDGFMETLKGDELVVCLSDDFQNWRKDVLPTYKGNRATVERPVHLYDIKEWLAQKYPTMMRPRLEADDVMGIMATEPHHGEDRIIVSADKDMQTIPGLLYRPHEANPKVREITLEFADWYHMLQTVTGDETDHYVGCPGAGPVAAKAALDHFQAPQPYLHEFTRGPRKGTTETRWRTVTYDTRWDAVVALFWKAGLTEKDALVQARVARILRHSDFDGRGPILWSPQSTN